MHQPHPTAEELSAHHRRELPPGETLAVSDHLAACATCREAFRGPGPGPAASAAEAVTGAPSPGVDYETFRAYLDGTLDPVDREILEADVRNHPAVAAQLEDLRRFRLEAEAPAWPPANVVRFPAGRHASAHRDTPQSPETSSTRAPPRTAGSRRC